MSSATPQPRRAHPLPPALTTALLIALIATPALATDPAALTTAPPIPTTAVTCAHPLQGATCARLYSLLSLPYMAIATTFTASALAILKPRLRPHIWTRATLAIVPASWLLIMLGFTLLGAAGLLTYPHDTSPFFFIDWALLAFILVTHAAYVVGVTKV